MDWLKSTAICEDAIKWYHIVEFLILNFAALWVVAKLATQDGYRAGVNWASGEFSKVMKDEPMDKGTQKKVVDFALERDKRLNRVFYSDDEVRSKK